MINHIDYLTKKKYEMLKIKGRSINVIMKIASKIIHRRKTLNIYGPLKYCPNKVVRPSPLSDLSNTDFSGFLNLFFLVVMINNLRLMIQNFFNYGIRFSVIYIKIY